MGPAKLWAPGAVWTTGEPGTVGPARDPAEPRGAPRSEPRGGGQHTTRGPRVLSPKPPGCLPQPPRQHAAAGSVQPGPARRAAPCSAGLASLAPQGTPDRGPMTHAQTAIIRLTAQSRRQRPERADRGSPGRGCRPHRGQEPGAGRGGRRGRVRPRRCGEGRDHRAAHVLRGPGPGRLQAAAHRPRGLPRPHVGAAAGAQRGRVRLRLGVIPTAAEADGRPWGVVFVRMAVGAERTGGKKWGDRGPGTVDGGPRSGGCGYSWSEGPAVRGGARRPDHEPDPVAVPSSTPPLTRQCVRGPHRAPWRGVRTRSGAQPPPPRPGRGAGGQAAGPAAISGGCPALSLGCHL